MKICKDCQTSKPLEEFPKQPKNKDGRNTYCSKCQQIRTTNSPNYKTNVRKAALKKYGITPEDYDNLFKKQKGVCGICYLPEPEKSKREYLCVDHDHQIGFVRGLLCHDCNIGLGKFRDERSRLQSAIFYLEKYEVAKDNKIRQMFLDNMAKQEEDTNA